jgi:predicted transcriptional regulator
MAYGYHMTDSIKTTVYLDAEDYRRLKRLAEAEGRPAAELVREAVAVYARGRSAPPRPSSLGLGRSGAGDVGERAEELLDGFGDATP